MKCVFSLAKYDYTAQGAQELDLRKNEKYLLLDVRAFRV